MSQVKKVILKEQTRFSPERYQKVDLSGSAYMSSRSFGFFDLYCFDPGPEQQGHTHAGSDKIYYVIEASARIEVADESETIEAGAAVLAPAGSRHAIKNASSSRLVVLVAMAPRPSDKPQPSE